MVRHHNFVTDDFLVEFGATVRRLRERRGMRQADLAERIGLGRTSMTNLERGNQNPPLSVLPLLARGLGVSTGELLAEVDATMGDPGDAILVAHVHDDALRSWANRVISNGPSAPQPSDVPTRRSSK